MTLNKFSPMDLNNTTYREPSLILEEEDDDSSLNGDDSPLNDPKIMEQAKSSSVFSTNVKFDDRLFKRLVKVHSAVELKYCYFNQTLGDPMEKESTFGEIALITNDKRQASIYSLEDTVLAYLDK